MRASSLSSTEREDGSHYYRQVTVDFGSRKRFGGMVRQEAIFSMEEDAEGKCLVILETFI